MSSSELVATLSKAKLLQKCTSNLDEISLASLKGHFTFTCQISDQWDTSLVSYLCFKLFSSKCSFGLNIGTGLTCPRCVPGLIICFNAILAEEVLEHVCTHFHIRHIRTAEDFPHRIYFGWVTSDNRMYPANRDEILMAFWKSHSTFTGQISDEQDR